MQTRQSAAVLSFSGFIALAVAMGIGRFAFTPMLPMMQSDAGLGLAEGGWLASANYLGYLVGALMAANMPWSATVQLRAGLAIVIVTTAAMGITDSWTSWLVWRFTAGVASAWVLVSTSSLCLTRLASLGQSRRAGQVFAGVGSGIAVAGLLCLIMTIAAVSSSFAWLMLGLTALLGAWGTRSLWITPSGPTGAAAAAQPNPDPSAKTFVLKSHWKLILCYGLFGFGYILPATFLPAQAKLLVADPALFGLAWPLFGLAAAVSTLLTSRLTAVYTRRAVWAVAQLIMAAGLLLPIVWPSLISIGIAAVCVGGTFMVVTMLGMQEAHATARTGQARKLLGALTAAFAAGQLAGPIIFSLTNEYISAGLGSALGLAAMGLLLSSYLLLKS